MRLIHLLVFFCISTFAIGQNRIAYLSNQSGNFDLFIIDEDGKNQQQLTQNQGWDWAPKWNAHLQAIQASQVPALLLDDLSDDEIESLTRTREEGGIIEQAARIHNRLAHYKNKAELARETGVSRSNICHLIRVHKLAEDIKAVIRAHPGKVKLGHAKVLAGLEIEQQRSLLDQVIQYGLSVHETETRAREMRSGEHCQQQHENPQDKPVEVIRLEQEVSQLIGCETRIEPAKHQLVIDYSNIDILDGILTRLGYEGSG